MSGNEFLNLLDMTKKAVDKAEKNKYKNKKRELARAYRLVAKNENNSNTPWLNDIADQLERELEARNENSKRN